MTKHTGEILILPPLGPKEKAALDSFCEYQNPIGPMVPSKWCPFKTTDKGLSWDTGTTTGSNTFFESYVDLATAGEWLKIVIDKFIKPLRHAGGKLVVEGEGVIVVNDNAVGVHPLPAPFGVKKDGTPKSKPGPKGDAKSLKDILAEKKQASSVFEPGSASPEESTKIVSDMQAKIVELEEQIAALKKPKKSKVPAGKFWVRLTVPKEIDKTKFVEGVKHTIMGIEGEPEVFE